MKQVLFAGLVAGCLGLSTTLHAQDKKTTDSTKGLKHTVKKAGEAISDGAKAVGNKTAELASKGKAGVVDKVYDGKKGPDGQKIYINDDAKYYWIDKKGHRHFVTKSELKEDNK